MINRELHNCTRAILQRVKFIDMTKYFTVNTRVKTDKVIKENVLIATILYKQPSTRSGCAMHVFLLQRALPVAGNHGSHSQTDDSLDDWSMGV